MLLGSSRSLPGPSCSVPQWPYASLGCWYVLGLGWPSSQRNEGHTLASLLRM
jgi:hypothetical protein